MIMTEYKEPPSRDTCLIPFDLMKFLNAFCFQVWDFYLGNFGSVSVTNRKIKIKDFIHELKFSALKPNLDIRREAIISSVYNDSKIIPLGTDHTKLVIAFAVFFEILDRCDPESDLEELDNKIKAIKNCDIRDQLAGNRDKLVYIHTIDEDILISIYQKYYKEMDRDELDKIYRSLSPKGKELLSPKKVIRKFNL